MRSSRAETMRWRNSRHSSNGSRRAKTNTSTILFRNASSFTFVCRSATARNRERTEFSGFGK
eukprot:4394724-Pleurochrysis_carterae.AAC.1